MSGYAATRAPANPPYKAAYDHWLQHNDLQSQNTELVTLHFLRVAFPGHHVTATDPEKCDLLGFAAAGFATATPSAADDPFHHATRRYKAPGYRLDKNAGEVQDDVRFGCWDYEWNGNKRYLVYQVVYRDRWARDIKLLYLLHPMTATASEHTKGGSTTTARPRHDPASDALLHAAGLWSRELHDEIYVFDNAEWKKSSALWRSVQGASWDDVILDPNTKSRLVADVEGFFDAQSTYQALKVPWKRGVIFHGQPGNGKTISIKALINSLAMRAEGPIPSLYVKSLDACAGPKWSIQEIFKKARNMAPCLLVFEDLDSMVTPKTRSYFLNEVDGLDSNDGILMIGSTNHLDHLDAAITKRPSRFDRKYHFKLPDEAARTAYCRYWAAKFAGSATVDFPDTICTLIAKLTPGFSFAYLQELFVASLLTLARGGIDDDDDDDDDEDKDDAAESSSESSSSHGSEVVVVIETADEKTVENATLETASRESACGAKAACAPQAEKPTTKMVMPRVDIPDELRENVLLRIVKKNAATLISEMDNSDDVPRKQPTPCDDGAPPLFSPAWFARSASSD